ncbi:MAG: hypothetical protein AB7I25_02525 [Vicinamibacterales bacterium]
MELLRIWRRMAATGLILALGLPLPALADGAMHTDPVIQAKDRLLLARLEAIQRRSPLWREAIEQLRASRRQVIVATPDQVIVKDSPDAPTGERFDPTVIAAAAPVPGPGNRFDTVLVVVNLPLLQALYHQSMAPPSGLHGDIDRILIHEVYGHAVPYLLAGDHSGRCADPAPGERATDACSVKRENAVRGELRLGRRSSYGLEDLTVTRHLR